MLFDPSVVWATLDDVAWGQVDQDGLDAARGDVRISLVESGVPHAVGYVRLDRTVGLDNLTDRREVSRTEDGEDRRQRRRSVRADGVRTLWRGNT